MSLKLMKNEYLTKGKIEFYQQLGAKEMNEINYIAYIDYFEFIKDLELIFIREFNYKILKALNLKEDKIEIKIFEKFKKDFSFIDKEKYQNKLAELMKIFFEDIIKNKVKDFIEDNKSYLEIKISDREISFEFNSKISLKNDFL